MLQWGFIFTNLLTAVGTLYGWANPFVGLMAYYAFAVLRPTFLWFWAYPNPADAPRYSLFVGVSTLVGWAFNSFGNWYFIRAVALPIIFFGVYLVSGLVAWSAADLGDAASQRSWDVLDTQLKIGLMFLVTLSLVRDAKAVRIFAWVLVACLGYLAWTFNSQYIFDGYNRVLIKGFGGIDNNGTAMIMVSGVPLAFFMGLNDPRMWVKGLCFFAALLLIHVVLLSFSRGAQLGLVLVGLTTFAVTLVGLPRKGLTLLLAAVFVLVSLRLAGTEVRQEFWSIFVNAELRDASADSRLKTWEAAWRCMQENPLGVGPRNFNRVSTRYGLPPNKSVHNLFLQTGADYGVAGMIGLAGFYFTSIWQTFRMARTRTAKRLGWPRYFGHMVCISLAGFIVCSIFIGMESVEVAYTVAMLGLCTVSYVKRVSASEPATELPVLPELQEVPPGDGRGGVVTA